MRTLALITLLALPLAAAAEIYTWKDASGKTHFSDRPPAEQAQTRELKSGKAGAGDTTAGRPAAEKENGSRKAEEGAPATSEQQAKAEADARRTMCENAKDRLKKLETKDLNLYTQNEKGERTLIVGDKRQAETEAARKDVEAWCK